MGSLLLDSNLWVAVGLVIFLAVVVRFGVHKMVGEKLDERAANISRELDEARRLREEAQQLLASYQRKQREAEEEAQAIIDQAESEAKRFAEETKAKLQEQLARRTEMAEQKIAQAESQAVKEVRSLAADIAIGAAQDVIAAKLQGGAATAQLDRAIAEVKDKLH
ncbi:F0F1 ATP synthase subunit B family protein [Tepidicaulis sp. LMO-SS28]|uniref:F0F1 ATP synthase subunit B family protein n=1 Tax=Tepidicaulis sp. LMO-SS28 TaxID=3447455 RepID=UPI003EDEE4E9